jgi:class 3 adenylate cyclase
MKDRVVFVPGSWLTGVPGGVDSLPALDTLVRELSASFAVDVFSIISGGLVKGDIAEIAPRPVAECAAALRACLSPGCHVLAMGFAAPEVLLALDRVNTASSLVCAGFHPGEGTFRAVEMRTIADVLYNQFGRGPKSCFPIFRLFFQDLPNDELHELVESVDRKVDWDAYRTYYESYSEVNLTRVRIEVPTLYLRSKLDFGGMHDLLLRIVPHAEVGASLVSFPTHLHEASTGKEVADAALDFFRKIGHETVVATVMVIDVVNTPVLADRQGDRGQAEILRQFHALVRKDLYRFSGRELDTAGDGVFAAFDSPSKAVRCAAAATETARALGLELRAGIHTGECELAGEKPAGIAVHIAAHVAQKAGPGEVLVSDTVKQLLSGSGLSFDDRGIHELTGVPDSWRIHALRPPS